MELKINSLYNYALLSALKGLSEGNFTKIFTLFARPIIADMGKGEVFDSHKFLEQMKLKYGIDWNNNIITSIIPYLERSGLIHPHQINKKEIYLCNAEPIDNNNNEINLKIQELLNNFKAFLTQNPSLTFSYKTNEDLLNILTDYLAKTNWISPESTKLPTKMEDLYHSDEDYVCARFIFSIAKSESITFLSELSSNIKLGALLQDFSIPKGEKKRFDNQRIFLDNTLLLSYLGLCGLIEEKNAKSLIDLLKDNDAQICVYSHTCDEAVNALKSLASHKETERFGLTWDAINNGEVTEDFIDYVIRNFETILDKNNINIVETENKASNSNFSSIFSELSFLENKPLARERDTLSVLYMIHEQKLERKSDVLNLKNIFITTNPKLVSAVKRYMEEGDSTGFNTENYANPFIVSSKMEFLLWLIYGNSDKEAAHIPMMQLICSADKVRRLKPEIFQMAQTKIGLLANQDSAKLKAMLEEPRYKQALADMTMNNTNIANKITAQEIINALEKENKKEIIALKAKQAKEIKRKDEEISTLKQILLNQEIEKEARINRIMINTSERKQRHFKKFVSWTLIALTIVSIVLSVWPSILSIWPIATWCSSVILFVLYIITQFSPKDWLIKKFGKCGIKKAIIKKINKENLNDILEQLEKQQRVDWDNYRIRDKGSLLTVQS